MPFGNPGPRIVSRLYLESGFLEVFGQLRIDLVAVPMALVDGVLEKHKTFVLD
jgi:hypothetical protein